MSTIREELSEIMSHGDKTETNETNKAEKDTGKNPEISEAIQEAMQEAFEKQESQKKEAEYQKRLSKVQAQKQREAQALQEATAPVIQALQKEMEQDKDFAALIEDNQDFPESLIQYCAESGEPEEAPAILRELASNEEYKKQLDKADTEIKLRRLIGRIRKDVLTGGTQGKIPPMLKNSIPQFNPNTSGASADDNYYKNVAVRHGIK